MSRKLSPAERNYDIGDRELLAVKVSLEEWRHWLEGADQPFLVYTDHKNLEYLRTAKRLNSRQARWALFFSRFNFHLSYRPGSKNVKPDVLSRLHDAQQEPAEPESILPPGCLVGAVTWSVERRVREANRDRPVPRGAPPNRLFVPPDLRGEVIQIGQLNSTVHPPTTITLMDLNQKEGHGNLLAADGAPHRVNQTAITALYGHQAAGCLKKNRHSGNATQSRQRDNP
ncbi:uncharacterized protein LOC129605033 [Betta splendens]|uniref:Uncharacterized protein LOC129605033 n=1 Tax=Betta splendens TaxID=158456 RepID=A0A9W2Y7Z0_BETSP|nr:uncharacterized protein LOC129605033 [Betta splendens]